jgi:uncharacterized protein
MAHDVDQEKDLTDCLRGLPASVTSMAPQEPAPVELWHPPFCGDIDMRIAADGTWFYQGSPITRPALVALFARILRKDPDRYVLVTPVECVGIVVEDVPFVGVDMTHEGETLIVTTNVGDRIAIGADHPLRFEVDATGGIKPYAHVRGQLWARLTRGLALDLADRAIDQAQRGGGLGIRSNGVFFSLDAQRDEAFS